MKSYEESLKELENATPPSMSVKPAEHIADAIFNEAVKDKILKSIPRSERYAYPRAKTEQDKIRLGANYIVNSLKKLGYGDLFSKKGIKEKEQVELFGSKENYEKERERYLAMIDNIRNHRGGYGNLDVIDATVQTLKAQLEKKKREEKNKYPTIDKTLSLDRENRGDNKYLGSRKLFSLISAIAAPKEERERVLKESQNTNAFIYYTDKDEEQKEDNIELVKRQFLDKGINNLNDKPVIDIKVILEVQRILYHSKLEVKDVEYLLERTFTYNSKSLYVFVSPYQIAQNIYGDTGGERILAIHKVIKYWSNQFVIDTNARCLTPLWIIRGETKEGVEPKGYVLELSNIFNYKNNFVYLRQNCELERYIKTRSALKLYIWLSCQYSYGKGAKHKEVENLRKSTLWNIIGVEGKHTRGEKERIILNALELNIKAKIIKSYTYKKGSSYCSMNYQKDWAKLLE